MSGESGSGAETSTLTGPPRHAPALERVVAAMYRDEGSALCLPTMAEIANLSPYHFARTFRGVTGVPPGEFLTAVRLERAKHLLLGTDLNVAEVCFEVGYGAWGPSRPAFPVVVGAGKRLFAGGTVPAGLRLIGSEVSTTGVIMATYESAGEIEVGSFALD